MSIEEITCLIQPPTMPREIPANPDWDAIEAELGRSLPQDYQHCVETYGSGLLGNFIRIFNPLPRRNTSPSFPVSNAYLKYGVA